MGQDDQNEQIVFNDLEIKPSHFLARRAGREICFTAQSFRLLLTLAREPGKIFTRDELSVVIGKPTDKDPENRRVDDHIFRLRKALGRPDIIRTVKDVGYGLKIGS